MPEQLQLAPFDFPFNKNKLPLIHLKSTVDLVFRSKKGYQIFHPFQIFRKHIKTFQSMVFPAFLRIFTGPSVWTGLEQFTNKLSGWQSLQISKPLLHVEEWRSLLCVLPGLLSLAHYLCERLQAASYPQYYPFHRLGSSSLII